MAALSDDAAAELIDQSNGILVPVGDASSLAGAIQRMIEFSEDEKIKMGSAGKQKLQSCNDALVKWRQLITG